ncbi:hypothetical protein BC835DRAFT_1404545 [Cytidiella melzeri]|nr:hypothetical protein BC835DRAFT_1404545 [Cytidiella melzeri]
MPSMKAYGGFSRKLVLAFDVGTTYSGVAYAILDPGDIPKIQGVTRFPGQENGDFKIPSVLWYTQDGQVRAAGAEARAPKMTLIAEDEDLILVEWFKLHLRPDGMKHDLGLGPNSTLPTGKTIVDVFADFLEYLFRCTRHQRVHFVTEGEASLHYCIDSGLASDAVQAGKSVIVIDAGGGTVDLSTYHFAASTPIAVEEIAPPDCIFEGSTRVNVRAAAFLVEKLKYSKYGNDEDMRTMVDHFDKSVKPTFKDSSERSFIKFGSMRDKDPEVGIRSGQLLLEGQEIASFFEQSVNAIMEAARKQQLNASKPVTLALLVGGFAASPWLFARLKTLMQVLGLELSRPDNHTNKAVAEGAVSYYLGNVVSARVARLTYGVSCLQHYDSDNLEHIARAHKVQKRPSGRTVVPGVFSPILKKGTRVQDQQELSRPYFREATHPSALAQICEVMTCYRGSVRDPRWADEEPDFFTTLCTINADTSHVVKRKQRGTNGVFYQQEFNVVLSCGQTEMKAQIRWVENGVEKRGPAKIVYDHDATAC